MTSQADEEWVEKMSSRTFLGKETGEVCGSFIVARLIPDLYLLTRPLDDHAGIQDQVERDPGQRNRYHNLVIWRVSFYG